MIHIIDDVSLINKVIHFLLYTLYQFQMDLHKSSSSQDFNSINPARELISSNENLIDARLMQ